MGVDAWGFPGGLLRLDPAFAYVEPSSSWPLPWAECLTPAPNRCHCLLHFDCMDHSKLWELDNTKGWALKNWCLSIVVLEKTLESPLDSKEIKPVNPKGNQPWIFIGRTETEAPIFWPSDVKSNHWKKPWCWERLKAGREGDDRG